MARIFINYRRDDAPGVAGRLFDHLALKFPRRNLFMDVDAMTPGIDFVEQLDLQVSQCRALLAVIGPRWLDARDQDGGRRLDSDKDYVRIELASALKRNIPVIPILVDGATMPPEDKLPDDLKPLVRRHALELRHTRFGADADVVVHALGDLAPQRRAVGAVIAAGIAGMAVLIAIVALWPTLQAVIGGSREPPTVIAAQPAPANSPASTTAAPAPLPSSAPAPPEAARPASTPVPESAETHRPPDLPAGIKLGEILPGVTLPGSAYRTIEIAQAEPAACQVACRTDGHCVAWTYTQPAAAGGPAHCALKPLIPERIANVCCTSGIERQPEPDLREPPPVPPAVSGALRGIDLFGANLQGLAGAQVTVVACQKACRDQQQCVAWNYVRPKVVDASAHCLLKSRIRTQVHSSCCVAGIERHSAASPPDVAPHQ